MAVPCGHVICKPCSGKFMKPTSKDPHDPDSKEGDVRCYVCDADLSPNAANEDRKSKKKSKKAKEGLKPGIIELNTEGTGFAGGGKNSVRKEGVAFQV